MTELRAEAVSYRIGAATLLADVSLAIPAGRLTAIIGPNGAGKSTLLRLLAGLERPASGRIVIDGRSMATISPRDRAVQIAYLPQRQTIAWPMRVSDIVALGRFAHGSAPSRLGAEDQRIVADAMTSADCAHLAERAATELSGGELARVHLARMLAGQAPCLLADEPIAALDPRHQRDTLALLKTRAEQGCAVVVVMHDLTLACTYADQLIWLRDGKVAAAGAPHETMDSALLQAVFDLSATESKAVIAAAQRL